MTVVQTDVTKDAEAKALVDTVMKKYGRIDVLVKYVTCLLLHFSYQTTDQKGSTIMTRPQLTHHP